MNGQRLELARKRAGFSLRGLSDALGGQPSHQAIRKYEKGEMTPNSSVLVALAKGLGVSVDFLMSNQVQGTLRGSSFASGRRLQPRTVHGSMPRSWIRSIDI